MWILRVGHIHWGIATMSALNKVDWTLGLVLCLSTFLVHSQDIKNQQFSFASYYQHHMVLQRAPQRANVWGYAEPANLGHIVKVSVSSSNGTDVYQAEVIKGPATGLVTWRVKLNAYPASSTPHTIQASLGSHSPINVSDVLFGDVWVCSGQSNMAFMVQEMFNYSEEYAMASHFPEVRLLHLSEKMSTKPYYDVQAYVMRWSPPSKDSLERFSAVCWLYARHIYTKMRNPMGMILSVWGGTPIEAWSSPEALEQCHLNSTRTYNDSVSRSIEWQGWMGPSPPTQHHVLWNAMIHPLLNMTIYGVLWYQGEANINHDRDLYNCTFPSMISDWRCKWYQGSQMETKPNFPFGFVQLGPRGNPLHSSSRGTADIRWHQTLDKGFVPNPSMVNVFMAVACDLTDANSPHLPVHYRDKGTVGERLSFSGLSVAYGVGGIRYQGPWPSAMKIDSNLMQLQIVYDNGRDAIDVRVKYGFELCCNQTISDCPMSGKDWVPSSIMNFDNTSLTLSLGACANLFLTGVRYNWQETPCEYKQCAVYSVENQLPAPPLIVRSIKASRLIPHKPSPGILISYQAK